MNRLRVACGLILVLALVAWSGRDAWRVYRLYPWSPDQVPNDAPQFEARCAAVRGQLPARGVVGYRDLVPERPGQRRSERRHALVQYALVPLVVEWNTPRTPAVEVSGREDDPRVRIIPAEGP